MRIKERLEKVIEFDHFKVVNAEIELKTKAPNLNGFPDFADGVIWEQDRLAPLHRAMIDLYSTSKMYLASRDVVMKEVDWDRYEAFEQALMDLEKAISDMENPSQDTVDTVTEGEL